MTFLPIHVWIALSFEKETEPLPERGVISMKSCETEPKLRVDRGGSKRGATPGPWLALQLAGQPLWVLLLAAGGRAGSPPFLLKARHLFSMLK